MPAFVQSEIPSSKESDHRNKNTWLVLMSVESDPSLRWSTQEQEYVPGRRCDCGGYKEECERDVIETHPGQTTRHGDRRLGRVMAKTAART